MVTLRRDPAIRENYVHDAVGALAHYNRIANEASPQLEDMVMDDMYDNWSSQLDTLSEAIRTGAGVTARPDSRMEERERQAREAEAISSNLLKMRRRQGHEEIKRKRIRRKGGLIRAPNLHIILLYSWTTTHRRNHPMRKMKL